MPVHTRVLSSEPDTCYPGFTSTIGTDPMLALITNHQLAGVAFL